MHSVHILVMFIDHRVLCSQDLSCGNYLADRSRFRIDLILRYIVPYLSSFINNYSEVTRVQSWLQSKDF
jgi:hypothetical protein